MVFNVSISGATQNNEPVTSIAYSIRRTDVLLNTPDPQLLTRYILVTMKGPGCPQSVCTAGNMVISLFLVG